MKKSTAKIVNFCNNYLDVKAYRDGYINGLQVAGSQTVERIITGVSLSKRLIKAAIKARAGLIIVHHGLSSKQFGDPPGIFSYTRERIGLLLGHNINLAGYHLPLDAHPLIGNSVCIAKLLKLVKIKPMDSPALGPIGFIGELPRSMPAKEFVLEINRKLNTKSVALLYGKKNIEKVGIISGSAPDEFVTAKSYGADTFLNGSIRESNVRAVEEECMNFINAGHYNTEKLGILNLGNLIARKFNIKVEFVDIPCDV